MKNRACFAAAFAVALVVVAAFVYFSSSARPAVSSSTSLSPLATAMEGVSSARRAAAAAAAAEIEAPAPSDRTQKPSAAAADNDDESNATLGPFEFPAFRATKRERKAFPHHLAAFRDAAHAMFAQRNGDNEAAATATTALEFATNYTKADCGALVRNLCVVAGQPVYFRAGRRFFTSSGATRVCNEAENKFRFHSLMSDVVPFPPASPSAAPSTLPAPFHARTILVAPFCWEGAGYHLFLCVLNTWALMSQLLPPASASATTSSGAKWRVKVAILRSWSGFRIGSAESFWDGKFSQRRHRRAPSSSGEAAAAAADAAALASFRTTFRDSLIRKIADKERLERASQLHDLSRRRPGARPPAPPRRRRSGLESAAEEDDESAAADSGGEARPNATFWPWWSVVAERPSDVIDLPSLEPACFPFALVAGRAELTPQLQQQFRAALLRRLGLAPAANSSCRPHRVVVTVVDRRDTFLLRNSAELALKFRRAFEAAAAATTKKTKLEVVARVVVFENLGIREQMRVAVETDVLVGMHGNGLIWTAFQEPGAGALVELWPTHQYNANYHHIAGRNNIRRWSVVGSAAEQAQLGECARRCNAAIDVPDAVLDEVVAHVLGAKANGCEGRGRVRADDEYVAWLAEYARQKDEKRKLRRERRELVRKAKQESQQPTRKGAR